MSRHETQKGNLVFSDGPWIPIEDQDKISTFLLRFSVTATALHRCSSSQLNTGWCAAQSSLEACSQKSSQDHPGDPRSSMALFLMILSKRSAGDSTGHWM